MAETKKTFLSFGRKSGTNQGMQIGQFFCRPFVLEKYYKRGYYRQTEGRIVPRVQFARLVLLHRSNEDQSDVRTHSW